MSTLHLPRSVRRYPGLWLTGGVALVVLVVLALFGALDTDTQPPLVQVATLETEDIHVAAVIDDGRDTLVVGHHDGVLASTDGGRTWTTDLLGVDAMALVPKADHALLVGGHGFIGERAIDGTFEVLSPDLADNDVHGLARSRLDPERFWLVSGEGTLYRSIDGGASWAVIDEGSIVRVAAGADGADDLWAVDAFRGLVSSTDGGSTWSDGAEVPGAPVNALEISPDGSAMLLATGMGAFLSEDDGASWEPILDEPVAAAAFEDNPDGDDIVFLVTPAGDVFRYH